MEFNRKFVADLNGRILALVQEELKRQGLDLEASYRCTYSTDEIRTNLKILPKAKPTAVSADTGAAQIPQWFCPRGAQVLIQGKGSQYTIQ